MEPWNSVVEEVDGSAKVVELLSLFTAHTHEEDDGSSVKQRAG